MERASTYSCSVKTIPFRSFFTLVKKISKPLRVISNIKICIHKLICEKSPWSLHVKTKFLLTITRCHIIFILNCCCHREILEWEQNSQIKILEMCALIVQCFLNVFDISSSDALENISFVYYNTFVPATSHMQ